MSFHGLMGISGPLVQLEGIWSMWLKMFKLVVVLECMREDLERGERHFKGYVREFCTLGGIVHWYAFRNREDGCEECANGGAP